MLQVALKEWAVVCDLLLEGGTALLLRKGGIAEPDGAGVFEPTHGRFALFPSWAHQKPEMIREDVRARVQVLAEPDAITFTGMAEVVKIWRAPRPQALFEIDELHVYSDAQVRMRFDYKPDRPVWLLAVRAMKLARPVTIPNDVGYCGCRSWVPLKADHGVGETGAVAVLSDAALAAVVAAVDGAMSRHGSSSGCDRR
jgi:hypothetical protein